MSKSKGWEPLIFEILKSKKHTCGSRQILETTRKTSNLIELVRADVFWRIPADGRLIEKMNLHSDEAMLTGESLPVDKNMNIVKKDASLGDRKNLVFSGTLAAPLII